MPDVKTLYDDLKSHIDELAVKFVDKYIPADPNTPPAVYELDVKAYSVLCHAAFEEFIEDVVLTVADHSVNQWIMAKKHTDVIMALLSCHGAKLKIDQDEKSPEKKPFDYLRPLVEEAKATFSKEVKGNHGVSVLYLRGLLIPVAIEVTQNLNLLNSLKKLTASRGDYAHKGRVKAVLAPEDAKRYVSDVLDLCDDVRDKAMKKLV